MGAAPLFGRPYIRFLRLSLLFNVLRRVTCLNLLGTHVDAGLHLADCDICDNTVIIAEVTDRDFIFKELIKLFKRPPFHFRNKQQYEEGGEKTAPRPDVVVFSTL